MPIKRIKSNWHRPDEQADFDKSFDEVAGALAFIIWRIALESAKDLYGEGYRYDSDQQRVTVIAEFLAFLVQAADRIAAKGQDEDERDGFINALAWRLADHIQDNLEDLFGPGDYRPAFIDNLNNLLGDYAELSFIDGEPGYDNIRYFGNRILKVLGDDQTNRWVIDQIMELSAPEAIKHLKKSMRNLFR